METTRVKSPVNLRKGVYDSITDLIGNINQPTPIVILNKRINPHRDFTLGIKLERYNIFGSVKDRVALKMLQESVIGNGQTVLEASSGNTAMALVALGNAMDIPVEVAIPERAPVEKKQLLRLLGVSELWEAEDELCPLYPNEGARGLAKGLAESPAYAGKYVYLNQYENALNVQAHYESTGPEIWNQFDGNIDMFFAGFGTGATITGVGKYLKERNPDIKIIGVEPSSSNHSLSGLKRITDLAQEYIPEILDLSLIDEVIEVEEDDAYQMGVRLARKTGLLVGPTSGAIIFAALEYGKTHPGVAVAISPDDAFKYTNAYSQYLDRVNG
ncbi:MAG: PLP-dependent cysteine synthase family protein [Candidatus Marinimicrobia bacterium]|nr:PLP-dependent cysteine synthase family protein [Candidatus Neomarinimicrobiota bacterium]